MSAADEFFILGGLPRFLTTALMAFLFVEVEVMEDLDFGEFLTLVFSKRVVCLVREVDKFDKYCPF